MQDNMHLFCNTKVSCCSNSLNQLQPPDESIEDVIKDTESLFKSREKEYQDTIDQIEVNGAAYARSKNPAFPPGQAHSEPVR